MDYDWRENNHERRFGCLGIEASFMGAQIQAAACPFNSNEWKLRSNIPTGWTPPNYSPRRSKRLLAPKLNWWIVLEKEREEKKASLGPPKLEQSKSFISAYLSNFIKVRQIGFQTGQGCFHQYSNNEASLFEYSWNIFCQGVKKQPRASMVQLQLISKATRQSFWQPQLKFNVPCSNLFNSYWPINQA